MDCGKAIARGYETGADPTESAPVLNTAQRVLPRLPAL